LPDEPFDPWSAWLGIAEAAEPPDHYRLLGLEPFEHRAEAISAAADERMAMVRRHQTGPRAALSQQVLNRLAAAKQCLLNAATRDAYDAALRGALAARESAAKSASRPTVIDAPPSFDFASPPVAPFGDVDLSGMETRDDGYAAPGPSNKRPIAARRRKAPLMALSLALTAFTAAAAAWAVYRHFHPAESPPPVIVLKRTDTGETVSAEEASRLRGDDLAIVRADGGAFNCTAANILPADAHRVAGDVVDVTLVDARVEISWMLRVRKPGFQQMSITYLAAGDAGQTFELELDDETRRTTPIRNTAGKFATDELKPAPLSKTGDHRLILRVAGTPSAMRTIKVREVQLRPLGSPAPARSGR
jgi:hypothetical protein